MGLAQKVYSDLNKGAFEQFLYVEFGTRGDVELWTYYLNSNYDSTFIWTYNLNEKTFNLTTHPNYELFKKEVNNPLAFVKNLEDKKNEMGIKGVSNSPWPGHFIKFWISASEVLIYQPQGFVIDSEAKKIWQEEFKSVKPLDKNWIYLDLNKTE